MTTIFTIGRPLSKPFLALTIFMCCTAAFAQNNWRTGDGNWRREADEIKTLFSERLHIAGAFGGPMIHFASVNNSFTASMGGGGAILFDNGLYAGGYGLSMVTEADVVLTDQVDANRELRVGHGGLWLGYMHNYKEAIHLSFDLKLGFGKARLESRQFPSPSNDLRDNIFAAIPSVGADFNISRYFMIGAQVGYQLMVGSNLPGIEDHDLGSPTGTLTFKFGYF